jgi:YD repeat-containing protein
MVTIVNGSALGLQSSLTGTLSNVGSSVQGQNPDQVYVNSSTGNLIIQDQDEVLSSVGSGLSLVRTYNSQGGFDDPSGNNWRLSVEQRVFGLTGALNTAGSTITKEFGDGSQITYTYNASLGLYTAALGTGADDTLSYNSGTSTWTWTNGSTRATEQYNASGQMTSSADSSGNVTHYLYTGALLTQITDPSGQSTYLDYSGNNLVDIREVSNGATQKRVQYTYDSSNRLTAVAIDLTPANDSTSDPTYVTTYT